MQQRLRGLQDLHVGRLGLLDRLVVLVPRLRLPHEALVQLLQTIGENGELLLDLRLVFLGLLCAPLLTQRCPINVPMYVPSARLL